MINSDYLTTLEEFDAILNYQMPHLMVSGESILSKKKISYFVMSKSNDELMLINPMGFAESAILAALSEKNIEYFANHLPAEHKIEIMRSINDYEIMRDVIEIAKSTDEDEGDGSTKNQDRVKKVIQYIRDNSIVFQF